MTIQVIQVKPLIAMHIYGIYIGNDEDNLRKTAHRRAHLHQHQQVR